MKLIIRQYLASLKERDELDAILPDLLSQLGLTVYSRPGRGTRQDGVDVAATGCLVGRAEKVYLFSIKSGNLTRNTWDGDALQSLRPSLNEIIDSYIPNRLPSQHKHKPVVICLCFGGDIQEQVRPQVEGYIKENTKNGVEFEQWNGDVITDMISQSFLQEELLPVSSRSMLRKALAMLDEPEISKKHFSSLIYSFCSQEFSKEQETLTAIRQVNICLWILFAWCRDADNLESAYLGSEVALLNSWDLAKNFQVKNTKVHKALRTTFESILTLHTSIADEFLNKCIAPHSDKQHAISNAINSPCDVDLNIKLFDLLSRLSIRGVWLSWELRLKYEDEDVCEIIMAKIQSYSTNIKSLITNNPLLLSPYKDDQAIDIFIALYFLSLEQNNTEFIKRWLSELTHRARFSFDTHGKYPCTLRSYHELIEHSVKQDDSYRTEVTNGSILYPIIAIFSALSNFDEVYKDIQEFKSESLKGCNFQYWYPDCTSEDFFYNNSESHGAALSSLPIDKEQQYFLKYLFDECKNSQAYKGLSAVTSSFEPLIFVACRLYRLPIPIHVLEDFYELIPKSKNK